MLTSLVHHFSHYDYITQPQIITVCFQVILHHMQSHHLLSFQGVKLVTGGEFYISRGGLQVKR